MPGTAGFFDCYHANRSTGGFRVKSTGRAEIKITRTYKNIDPEMLYAELADIASRHGGTVDTDQSSKEVTAGGGVRGSIVVTFPKVMQIMGLGARIFGMTGGETKLSLGINEDVVPADKIKRIEEDLDFVAKGYEKGEGESALQ